MHTLVHIILTDRGHIRMNSSTGQIQEYYHTADGVVEVNTDRSSNEKNKQQVHSVILSPFNKKIALQTPNITYVVYVGNWKGVSITIEFGQLYIYANTLLLCWDGENNRIEFVGLKLDSIRPAGLAFLSQISQCVLTMYNKKYFGTTNNGDSFFDVEQVLGG